MSDYYETLKPKVNESCTKLADRFKDLDRQIDRAEKQLQNEVDNVEKLQQRITKLKKTAGESIAESQLSYEKFKVSLKKLHADEEVSAEIVEALRNEFIPKLKDERAECIVNLELSLQNIGVANCGIADSKRSGFLKAVTDALLAFQAERKQVVAAWQKLYSGYGLTFSDSAMTSDMLPTVVEGIDNNTSIQEGLKNG